MDAKSTKLPQKAGKNRPKPRKKLQKSANSHLPILPKAPLSPKKAPGRQRQGRWVPKNRPKIPPKTRAKKLSTIPAARLSPPASSPPRRAPRTAGPAFALWAMAGRQDRPWHTPRGGQARRLNGRANVRRSAAGGESTLAMDLAGSYHNGIVLKGAGHLPGAGRGARSRAGGAANQEHADEIARLARRIRRQGRSGKPG